MYKLQVPNTMKWKFPNSLLIYDCNHNSKLANAITGYSHNSILIDREDSYVPFLLSNICTRVHLAVWGIVNPTTLFISLQIEFLGRVVIPVQVIADTKNNFLSLHMIFHCLSVNEKNFFAMQKKLRRYWFHRILHYHSIFEYSLKFILNKYMVQSQRIKK
jgi:hypothetical protein